MLNLRIPKGNFSQISKMCFIAASLAISSLAVPKKYTDYALSENITIRVMKEDLHMVEFSQYKGKTCIKIGLKLNSDPVSKEYIICYADCYTIYLENIQNGSRLKNKRFKHNIVLNLSVNINKERPLGFELSLNGK